MAVRRAVMHEATPQVEFAAATACVFFSGPVDALRSLPAEPEVVASGSNATGKVAGGGRRRWLAREMSQGSAAPDFDVQNGHVDISLTLSHTLTL